MVDGEVVGRTITGHQVYSLGHLREGRIAPITHLLKADDYEPGHQAVDHKATHSTETRLIVSGASHIQLGNRFAKFVEHVKESVNFSNHFFHFEIRI